MSRQFRSARAALGTACAVRGHTATLSTVSAARGGQAPDQATASDVYACLARAGLDPHEPTPLLEAVQRWATNTADQDLDAQLASKLDALLRRFAAELEGAGLVVRDRPTPVSWRAVMLDGKVRYHACGDAEAGHSNLEQLQDAVERGLLAAQPSEPCKTVLEQLMADMAVAHAAGDISTRDIDEQLQAELGIKAWQARDMRKDQMGITNKHGDPSRFMLDNPPKSADG